MSLTIITGTLMELKDNAHGTLLKLYEKGFFLKHQWNGQQYTQYDPGIIIVKKKGTEFDIIQETGAGKTILGAKLIFFAALNGRKVGGNLKLKWADVNKGKPKEEWQPTLQSMKDIEGAHNIVLFMDDIYGTCEAWNTKESKMLSVLALIARKAWTDFLVSSQFLENQVPTNLRRICGEYHIPFISAEDKTRISPDGKHYTPVEMIDFVFTSNRVFKYAKVIKLSTETGQEILNGFDTLEVAQGLRVDGEDRPGCTQNGYDVEVKALAYLKEKMPHIEFTHLSGKRTFDIITDTLAIDVCSVDPDGNLITRQKSLNGHMCTANKKGQIPYLMFPWRGEWGFLKITAGLHNRHKGERIDTYNLTVKTIDGIVSN